MSHYKSNLRDVEFNLFEYLDVASYYGSGPFEGFDRDMAMDSLREVERLAVQASPMQTETLRNSSTAR